MKIVFALVAAATIALPLATPVQAQTCPFKQNVYVGDWPVIGTKVLEIKSVATDCTSAIAAYGGSAAIQRPIEKGVLLVACGPNLAGTCSFKPEGDNLNATYADSLNRKNAATFRKK